MLYFFNAEGHSTHSHWKSFQGKIYRDGPLGYLSTGFCFGIGGWERRVGVRGGITIHNSLMQPLNIDVHPLLVAFRRGGDRLHIDVYKMTHLEIYNAVYHL